MNQGGYIYVFGSMNITKKEVTFYKIGVTQNRDFEIRIKSLQTGNPAKIILVSAIYVNSIKAAYVLERHFHWRFKECRSSGEWFCPSPSLIEFAEKGIFEYGESVHGYSPEPPDYLVDNPEDYKKTFFGKLVDSLKGEVNV